MVNTKLGGIGVKHIEETEYNWKYDRTNSKGETILRHNTNQTIEQVINFLEDKGIKYDIKEGANMLWIYTHEKKFCYYFTTGRWAAYVHGRFPNKHYRSKGIKDFYTRFLLPVILKERKIFNYAIFYNESVQQGNI